MDNQKFIQQAVDLALENVKRGGRPFAALVVKNNEIISTGINQIKLTNDPTAHAELLALREAGRLLSTPNLEDSRVYASGQPCPMCLAAIRMAGISKVFFAFSNTDAEPFGLSTAKIAELLRVEPQFQEGLEFTQLKSNHCSDLYAIWQRQQ